MEEKGLPRDEVLRLLEELKKEDSTYSSGRILSSMCTAPHPLAREVFCSFIESNLGDPGLFGGTRRIEELAVKEIGELLGSPRARGFIVSGGTEANLLALWAAREMGGEEIIVPRTAHFSFQKAARILNLQLVSARVKEDRSLDVEDVERKLSSRTCALVGIAGSTEYGAIDDIPALSEIAREENLFLHVDAAFGGFVIPFLGDLGYTSDSFDFSLQGVSSMTTDPHKMGLAPVPSGCILFRREEYLEGIESIAPYLIEKKQYTVQGTRSGAGAAATLAVLRHLGREGYREVVGRCMEVTAYLYRRLKTMGLEVYPPRMNILVFSHPVQNRIASRLLEKRWKISQTKKGEIRLLIMPHVKKEDAEVFIEDLKDILLSLELL